MIDEAYPSGGDYEYFGMMIMLPDMPGVTRSVLTRIRICDQPLVYLIDTPGIMVPNIRDMHVGLKLALCCKLKIFFER